MRANLININDVNCEQKSEFIVVGRAIFPEKNHQINGDTDA